MKDLLEIIKENEEIDLSYWKNPKSSGDECIEDFKKIHCVNYGVGDMSTLCGIAPEEIEGWENGKGAKHRKGVDSEITCPVCKIIVDNIRMKPNQSLLKILKAIVENCEEEKLEYCRSFVDKNTYNGAIDDVIQPLKIAINKLKEGI